MWPSYSFLIATESDDDKKRYSSLQSRSLETNTTSSEVLASINNLSNVNNPVDVNNTSGVNNPVDVNNTSGVNNPVDVNNTSGVNNPVDVNNTSGVNITPDVNTCVEDAEGYIFMPTSNCNTRNSSPLPSPAAHEAIYVTVVCTYLFYRHSYQITLMYSSP